MENYFHKHQARKSCVIPVIITLILVLLCVTIETCLRMLLHLYRTQCLPTRGIWIKCKLLEALYTTNPILHWFCWGCVLLFKHRLLLAHETTHRWFKKMPLSLETIKGAGHQNHWKFLWYRRYIELISFSGSRIKPLG